MRRLVIVICLLLVLTACTTRSSGPQDFRTGTQALEMRFAPSTPTEVFEGESLNMLLELRNRGTADITNGLLVVKGFDPQYLPNLRINPTPVINIEGKDEFDPRGDLLTYVEIVDQRVRAPAFAERLPQTLNVVACYPYTTYGSYEVCIDPDPQGRRIGTKVCSYTEVRPGAQGHPVAVTSIEQRVGATDIRFILRLTNVGNGIVYDRRLSPEACAYDLQARSINLVDVRRVEFSGNVLRCDPSNPVRLHEGGSAVITCVCTNCVNIDQGAYRTVLNVELAYGYRNDIQRRITIRKH